MEMEPRLGFLRGVSLANHLESNDNLTRTTKRQNKQACAAEIAVRYAALICKQNKRYHTSARLTKTRDRCSKVSKHGTDGQTECNAICGPSYGGGPHNN